MKNEIIGDVEIDYNEDGDVMNVSFKPKLGVDLDETVKRQLGEIKCKNIGAANEVDAIQQSADRIFGTWANKVVKMAEADRSEYHVKSMLLDCKRYAQTRKVKKCVFRYLFEKAVKK